MSLCNRVSLLFRHKTPFIIKEQYSDAVWILGFYLLSIRTYESFMHCSSVFTLVRFRLSRNIMSEWQDSLLNEQQAVTVVHGTGVVSAAFNKKIVF